MRVLLVACLCVFAGPSVAEDKVRKINVPPKGFTALFNGKDLTNWQGLAANPRQKAKMTSEQIAAAQKKANARAKKNWTITEEGVLRYSGKGNSLQTAKNYKDFEMLVDWKIGPRGDSGIYVRGTPQIQIWDPNQHKIGSGGLYNNKKNPSKPLKTADKPIGEWNRFRIKMVKDKVWVWLNGELVVDNTTLENFWDRSKPVYRDGPIELQHHGNPLFFRNIFIRELDEDGSPTK